MTARNSLKIFVIALALTGTLAACDMVTGRETPVSYVESTTISAKVKIDLANDPVIGAKPMQITVETLQGVVLLSGFVDTAEMSRRAEAIARKVEGVKGVRNALQVPSGYQKR